MGTIKRLVMPINFCTFAWKPLDCPQLIINRVQLISSQWIYYLCCCTKFTVMLGIIYHKVPGVFLGNINETLHGIRRISNSWDILYIHLRCSCWSEKQAKVWHQ